MSIPLVKENGELIVEKGYEDDYEKLFENQEEVREILESNNSPEVKMRSFTPQTIQPRDMYTFKAYTLLDSWWDNTDKCVYVAQYVTFSGSTKGQFVFGADCVTMNADSTNSKITKGFSTVRDHYDSMHFQVSASGVNHNYGTGVNGVNITKQVLGLETKIFDNKSGNKIKFSGTAYNFKYPYQFTHGGVLYSVNFIQVVAQNGYRLKGITKTQYNNRHNEVILPRFFVDWHHARGSTITLADLASVFGLVKPTDWHSALGWVAMIPTAIKLANPDKIVSYHSTPESL